MVILQFNKLIRNKWIWGAFAVAISAFFAFDFLIDDLNREDSRETRGLAGTLDGKAVKLADFQTIADELRGFGQQRDWKRPQHEVNRQAWENYAAAVIAGRDGLEASDADVAAAIRSDRTFQQDGAFNFMYYQAILRENGLSPEKFEAYLKRQLTLRNVSAMVLGSAVWASPMEVDRTVWDMTDNFTVRVARFSQSKEDADKITVDDAAIRKWYDENSKSIELPARVKIRYVKFDATNKDLQARMTVTDDELHDLYDTTSDQYKTTDTNGVETVKTFDEVKGELEAKARLAAAVQYFETNLNFRVYGVKAVEGKSRLDEIAAEEKLAVQTSDWFALEGGVVEGFMRSVYSVLPGASDFAEKVAELDSETETLRYGVVSGERAVWLVERFAESPAHVPTFDEAKAVIRPRVLRDAKADAFKASVEAVIAKGKDAVLATPDVSTNITFSISDLRRGAFPDQNAIAGAARKLAKDGVSEFTLTSTGRALVVVCIDRAEGDAAKAMTLRSQIASQLTGLQRQMVPEAWMKWNLETLGFEPSSEASVEAGEAEE